MPHAGYVGVAEFTAVSDQIIGRYSISQTFDQQVFAIMAIGVVSLMPRYIADINVTNAQLHRQLSKTGQCGDRGRGQAI